MSNMTDWQLRVHGPFEYTNKIFRQNFHRTLLNAERFAAKILNNQPPYLPHSRKKLIKDLYAAHFSRWPVDVSIMSHDPRFPDVALNVEIFIGHTTEQIADSLMEAANVIHGGSGYNKVKLDSIEQKCECGGKIARTPHSHWCPKYE